MMMNKVLSIAFPHVPESVQPPEAQVQRLAVDYEGAGLDELDSGAWGPNQFARRQLCGLVQRVFFPGWPHPSRQVVVSSVDQSQSGKVCAQIAQAMAEELPGNVCAVEAASESRPLEEYMVPHPSPPNPERARVLHPNCTLVGGNLWLLTLDAFLREGYDQAKVAWLRSRLGALRREFDYTIIHTPSIAVSGDVVLFGQLSDGVILVLEADSTRHAAAISARDALLQANVRLLGSVLNQRTFPVPRAIYSNL